MHRTLALIVLVLASGCATTAPGRTAATAADTDIHHFVFFTLKDPADRAALVADCRALFAMPQIQEGVAGPRLATDRESASLDTSFDVGLYTRFATQDDYDGYLVHPDHVALVETWGARLEGAKVMDVGR